MPNVLVKGKVIAFSDELNPDELRSAVSQAADQIPTLQEKSRLRKIAEFTVKSPVFPIAGGVIGTTLGAPTGIGVIPLAGLGAAGGEGLRQTSARLLGIPAPKTSTEAAKKMVTEAGLSMVGEAGGQLVFRGGARMLAPFGRQVRKFFSATTGVREPGFNSLIEKPLRLFQSSKNAGKKVGELVEETISKDLTPIQSDLLKVEQAFQSPAGARGSAKKVAIKLTEGKEVLPSEVALANRAINKVIDNTPVKSEKKLLGMQKEKFQDYLAEKLPELKKANEEFHKLKSAGEFRHISRLNKSGETSRLGAMMMAFSPKNPLVAMTSPAVVGGALAAGSAAVKSVSTPLGKQLIPRVISSAIPETEKRKIKKAVPSVASHSFPLLNPVIPDAISKMIVKVLTDKKAKEYLIKAGQDKNKARQMALQDGWEIPD